MMLGQSETGGAARLLRLRLTAGAIGSLMLASIPVAASAQDAITPPLPPCGAGYGRLISTQVINLPTVDTEHTVEIGEGMVSAVRANVHEGGLVLEAPVVLHGRYTFSDFDLMIPPEELRAVDGPTGRVYVPADYVFKYQREGRPRGPGPGRPTVTLSVDPTDGTRLIGVVNFGLTKSSYPVTGATFSTGNCTVLGTDSFRRELIYSGVSQGTVSIEYREFINDMARPAFSQTLRYDLAEGDVIGFRGARFQILDATNIDIRFKVTRPLE